MRAMERARGHESVPIRCASSNIAKERNAMIVVPWPRRLEPARAGVGGNGIAPGLKA